MLGEFEVEYGARTTPEQNRDIFSTLDGDRPAHGWQFANDFQHAMGAEAAPDELFFVESWTLGPAQAIDNLRQRRERDHDLQSQSRWTGHFDYFGNASVVQDLLRPAETFSSSRFVAERSSILNESLAWRQNASAHKAEHVTAEPDFELHPGLPATAVDAFGVLGVPENSTRSQIKAAFRSLVSKWHPDRFEGRNERERQRATEKMAVINKAYELLRNVA